MSFQIDLPQSFFEPEEQCGYLVTAPEKELWAHELDILNYTIRVFEEHNIRYFAMGGTLLGAARHGGFIPWDNDIDIILPREDYDILLKNGAEWFQPPFFFQTPCTERGFFRSHIQIRKLNTLGYIPKDANRPGCRGVFIDLFVLDDVPESKLLRTVHVKLANMIRSVGVLAMDCGSKNLEPYGPLINPPAWIANKLVSAVGFGNWFLFYHRFLSLYKGSKTTKIAHMTILYHEGKCWDKADFAESRLFPFHTLQISGPVNYLNVLKRQYGDNVMEIPTTPPASAHGTIIYKGEQLDNE